MESSTDDSKPTVEFQEDDVSNTLPRSTTLRVITENIPLDFNFEKRVGTLINECGVEFVKMLTYESNQVAEKEGMSTIVPRHVVAALKELGFGEYVAEAQVIIDKAKGNQKIRANKKTSIEKSGLSVEELLAEQEELFEKAKEKFQVGRG